VVDARILSSCFDEDDLKYSDSEDEDEDEDNKCICDCGGEFKCMGCECNECEDICIAKLPCEGLEYDRCKKIGWLIPSGKRLCNSHSVKYAKQLYDDCAERGGFLAEGEVRCELCQYPVKLEDSFTINNWHREFCFACIGEATQEENRYQQVKHDEWVQENQDKFLRTLPFIPKVESYCPTCEDGLKLDGMVPQKCLMCLENIYECNTCQEDFDRANPIWIAMGIKDSNYCLPCELEHEQPIECEMCKGMFEPDDICDDRCAPCYENYQEWLKENDMDA